MLRSYYLLSGLEIPPFTFLLLRNEKNELTFDIRFFQVFSKSIYHLCTDPDSLRYATKSVLSNFQADGVHYLELRTTPRESPEYGISKERYVTEVLDSIDAFKRENPEQMSIYLILSVDRANTAAQAMEVVDLALKYKTRGVLAVDLCGNPLKGDVSIFRDAFAKAKLNGLSLTLHFAETSVSGSIIELETLLSFDPDRLGHVIHVPQEIKEEIVRRKLGLELCISCNVLAELTPRSFPEHHFGYWRHYDCPIALCVSGNS
jgi:adenosine deaminase